MASVVLWWFVGCAYQVSSHLVESVWPSRPKIMLHVCGELYVVKGVGHVSGEE